ncbi:MAG TPA: inositol-3-phosphate synthase [Allosphingosinicella sp.]|nr:inositol-3-phosphate synthase [Allosphingosinicella sp.]
MNKIKVALVGIGNCASSLVQGRYFYAGKKAPAGLMHERLGGYAISDITFVAAFDTDARKVGKDLSEAVFAMPNCTTVFQSDIPQSNVTVRMGKVLDGMAPHMLDAGERGFVRADAPEASEEEIVAILKETGAEVLVNYLPVGSEEATRFYMECALKAGVAVVNCMPVFIASDPQWEKRFRDKGLPIVGDDIKAQLGATIVHRVLSSLFRARGVQMTRTYQLNTGGNTDFMNMLDRNRLASKKESKTEAVQSALVERLDAEDIHIGPSDYIPFLDDNKLCFLRAEGNLFGDVPMNLELRLSVEDSPNSAAVVVDAIRCCKVALDRGVGGVLTGPSAFFCKHPPQQFSDDVAAQLTEEFIAGEALAAE